MNTAAVARTVLLTLIAACTFVLTPAPGLEKPAFITLEVQYLAGLANAIAAVLLVQVQPIQMGSKREAAAE